MTMNRHSKVWERWIWL